MFVRQNMSLYICPMRANEKIRRYLHIINCVRRYAYSFEEIRHYLQMRSGLEEIDYDISLRTFQRDLKEIYSIFSIEIKYIPSSRNYKIVEDYIDDVQARMFEALDVLNALQVTDPLKDNIHFGTRIPQGTEYIFDAIHAIKRRYQVKITHQKFFDSPTTERTIDPLGLKEFRHRWYLVGRDAKDQKIKTFGLDRTRSLHLTRQHFTPPESFNLDDYFRYSFGVIVGGSTSPEPVVLSFTPFQGKYIKTLPLHHSQEIIKDTKEELRVRLLVYPTHDFIMEILSMTPEVRVIGPANLRKEVAKRLQKGIR